MWAMDYPKLKSFVSIVIKCCETVGRDYFHMRDDTKFECNNLWMMCYNKGDYANDQGEHKAIIYLNGNSNTMNITKYEGGTLSKHFAFK